MFGMDMGADMMDMGAIDMGIGEMDIGIGSMDINMGAIDMEIGAMDMAMGDAIAGMEMMAVGEMDMAVGSEMMGIGAMNMGIGAMEMEMGVGMNMMGGGMNMMGGGMGRGYVSRPMMRPMGVQYQQRPVIPQTFGQVRMGPNMNNQQQRNMYMKQGNMQMNQQAALEQNLGERKQKQAMSEIEQPDNIKVQLQHQQELESAQRQKTGGQNSTTPQNSHYPTPQHSRPIYPNQLQHQPTSSQTTLKQPNNSTISPYNSKISNPQKIFEQSQANKFEVQGRSIESNPYGCESLLMIGSAHRMMGSNWEHLPSATVTKTSFIGLPIQTISKVKVKAESRIPGTRIIKISTFQKDYFFSVTAQLQKQWMAALIQAKLSNMGIFVTVPSTYQLATLQANILKKSFFGGWESKKGSINGSIFRICNDKGSIQKAVSDVEQIWTRFQIVSGCFVVKMHTFGKLEVGVPMEQALLWMFGFYNLIK